MEAILVIVTLLIVAVIAKRILQPSSSSPRLRLLEKTGEEVNQQILKRATELEDLMEDYNEKKEAFERADSSDDDK